MDIEFLPEMLFFVFNTTLFLERANSTINLRIIDAKLFRLASFAERRKQNPEPKKGA
jgi:hypothetical protein